jgi:hypothetical protein
MWITGSSFSSPASTAEQEAANAAAEALHEQPGRATAVIRRMTARCQPTVHANAE